MARSKSNKALKFLSLTLTPWVIFLSSSLNLFLLNMESVDYNISVLTPFLALTVLGVIMGYGILFDCEKHKHYMSVPWMFYLAGPAFLLCNSIGLYLQMGLGEPAWFILFLILFAIACVSLRKLDYTRTAPFFAAFAVLVIISDLVNFAWKFEAPPQSIQQESAKSVIQDNTGPNQGDAPPNIYHVLLDGYQSDVFGLTMDEELISELAGFRFFKNNTTLFGKTRTSIPVVFSGQTWRLGTSLKDFTHAAFNSKYSLLGVVSDSGYKTSAYLHQELDFSPNLFEEVHLHHEFSTERPWADKAFLWVWLYTYSPRFISAYFLGSKITGQIQTKTLSPDNYPINSLDVFRYFLANEQHEAATGRYIFLHLILPHPPYMLDDDCSINNNGRAKAQFICANKLIVQLVRELKRLDRFYDSMIIFHADHGDDLVIRGEDLHSIDADRLDTTYNRLRSKALLLVKPFGDHGEHELLIDDTRTTLMDILPTIAEGLGRAKPGRYEGFSLSDQDRDPGPRYYYYHAGRDMHRYLIRGDDFFLEAILKPD
jgi:hypothetical protein